MLRFAVVSGVLTALIGTVLSLWLSNLIRSTSVNQARADARYSISLALDLTGARNNAAGSRLSVLQDQASASFLHAMVATDSYVGAVAWSSPTLIGFAPEPGRTGHHETSRPEVKRALAGELVSTVVTKPAPNVPDPTERAGLAKAGPLLEVFVPVRMRGHVLAAVQVYQRWQPVQDEISSRTHQMLLIVAAGLGVLWLGLLGFVLSASRELRTRARTNWHLASHDALTGLPNRKLLRERVTQALAAAERTERRVGLLLLDLDGFKEVNDDLGHHTGDLLLQLIGPRLRGILREADSVARLGGDEFVVLLPDIDDLAEAHAAARRIADCLAEPFDVGSVRLEVRASIGIAVSPQDGTDFDALLQRADVAMYTAKNAGTGIAVYATAKHTAGPRKLAMLSELRQALHEPDQFEVAYRPIADLVSGEIGAVHACHSWRHPTEGLVSPSEFIPVAERTGLIVPLTALLLERVLEQARSWQAAGLALGVSLRVSPQCLLDQSFVTAVNDLLHRHGVEPGRLVLEFAESVTLAEQDQVGARLAELSGLGVQVAISGFGTGYASMANIRRLPIDRITIDRSFVAHLDDDSTGAAIVGTYVDLAYQLGLLVVAEGVETAAQWHRLTELGVHLAQGHYLADPRSAAALTEWLADRGRRIARSADESALRR